MNKRIWIFRAQTVDISVGFSRIKENMSLLADQTTWTYSCCSAEKAALLDWRRCPETGRPDGVQENSSALEKKGESVTRWLRATDCSKIGSLRVVWDFCDHWSPSEIWGSGGGKEKSFCRSMWVKQPLELRMIPLISDSNEIIKKKSAT